MNLLKVLVVILVLNSDAVLADKLEGILQQHFETLGDINAWKEVVNLTYKLDINEPGFSVKGIYRVTRSGKMRIDIFASDQHVFTEAFDGQLGWQWRQGEQKPKRINGKSAAALSHGIDLPGRIYTLLDMKDNKHQLEYIGEEQWQGRPAHLLKLTLKDGHQKYYVLEKKTGIVLANRDKRAFHPDIDNTEVMIETRISDLREYRGTQRSFQIENWDLTNQKALGTTQVTELLMNTDIEDSYFEIDNFSKANLAQVLSLNR